jgi:hypothetical protein
MERIQLQEQPEAIALEVVEKGRAGRKRKLTPALFEKIMCSIQVGDRVKPACFRYGIATSTLFAQINRYPELAQRFAEAKAMRLQHWHDEWLGEMCEHSKRSPWATGFLLERNFPHLYALRTVNRDNSSAEQLVGNEISAERLAAYGRLMLEMAEENKAREAAKGVELPVNGQAES